MEILETLGVYWPKLIAQTINFGLVVFILWRFAYKPVLALLDQRKQTIADSLAKAEQIEKDLADTENRCRQILSEANAKAQQMIEEARASADTLGARKIQDATAQAESVLRKAREAAERDRDQMMQELRGEMGRLVVETTAKVVGRSLTPDDRKRLQDEAIAQLS